MVHTFCTVNVLLLQKRTQTGRFFASQNNFLQVHLRRQCKHFVVKLTFDCDSPFIPAQLFWLKLCFSPVTLLSNLWVKLTMWSASGFHLWSKGYSVIKIIPGLINDISLQWKLSVVTVTPSCSNSTQPFV